VFINKNKEGGERKEEDCDLLKAGYNLNMKRFE